MGGVDDGVAGEEDADGLAVDLIGFDDLGGEADDGAAFAVAEEDDVVFLGEVAGERCCGDGGVVAAEEGEKGGALRRGYGSGGANLGCESVGHGGGIAQIVDGVCWREISCSGRRPAEPTERFPPWGANRDLLFGSGAGSC